MKKDISKTSTNQTKLITQKLLKKDREDVIDSKDFGTLGAYFEADAAQKKIKELEQQLVEKDKEIDKWKKAFELSCSDRLIKIRHQICEKIREKLDNVRFDNYKDGDTPYYLNWCVKIEDAKQILDQIEQGEEV